MNKLSRSSFAVLITLLSLIFFQARAFAAVIYIGDYVVAKVASQLEDAKLEHVDITPLIIAPDRLAALSNLPDWWPEAMQVINSYPVSAVIISLGINDMSLRASDFPGDSSLDASVASILEGIRATTSAAVFWVVPPIAAADRSNYIGQRNAVVRSINRAQQSGHYQDLYVIDLDFWASQNDVELIDLLTANKEGFTSRGAAICADIVVSTVNAYTAP
jgi:hypothetical protein